LELQDYYFRLYLILYVYLTEIEIKIGIKIGIKIKDDPIKRHIYKIERVKYISCIIYII